MRKSSVYGVQSQLQPACNCAANVLPVIPTVKCFTIPLPEPATMRVRVMPRANSNFVSAVARCATYAAIMLACAGHLFAQNAQNTAPQPAAQAGAPTTSALYNQGLAAEQASDWETAFV